MERSFCRGRALGGALGLGLALAWIGGCSLPLAAIKVKSVDRAVAQVQRAGQLWGCKERPSEWFLVYLVCPKPRFTVGVMERDGDLVFACPDYDPEHCEKLGRKALRDGSENSQEVVQW